MFLSSVQQDPIVGSTVREARNTSYIIHSEHYLHYFLLLRVALGCCEMGARFCLGLQHRSGFGI